MQGRRPAPGFTLIEVMITVAIVAILATIATVSYQGAVIKTRRSAAAACLEERAQALERHYTINMTYVGAPMDPSCGADLEAFYTVGFVGAPAARRFTIAATPRGAQARDTTCGILRLDSTGARSASLGSEAECW
ncbi:type IV pilin protein [Coralloluteibacterium stylophorae]|nr:type IV pilin protein [Coralloluteibacterium stylophorae]